MRSEPESEEKRIANGQRKFSELSAKGKITVFRDYYLLPILLVLALIAGIVWFIHDGITNKKTIYSGATVGFDVSDDGNIVLTQGFIDSMGSGYSKKQAVLSRDAIMKAQENAEYNQQSFEYAFTVQISAGEYQYVLMDKKNFEHYAGYDFYSSMDSFRSNAFNSEVFYEGDDGHAYGICLPERVLKKIGVEGKEIYLGFTVNGKAGELNEKFLTYLFS